MILEKRLPLPGDPSIENSIEDPEHYMFFCPGCKNFHTYYVLPDRSPSTNAGWNFNGNMEKPSFTPSLLYSGKKYPGRQCHLYVTDGKIHYCGDCDHDLKGQVVDMIDMDTI